MEDSTTFELKLPGFRFHPTEEELLSFYLKNMIFQKEPRVNVIGFLNIYRHDPWDLPGLARTKIGEREWYFFVPRDRKSSSGGRPNRTTEKGFWKATGSDRKVISLSEPKKMIGLKKTLVFYKGRAPRGCKTDWIMNEFRLPDTWELPKDIVLCKIYRKATSMKALEQRLTTDEETFKKSPMNFSPPITPTPSPSPSSLDDGPHLFSNTRSNCGVWLESDICGLSSDTKMETRVTLKEENKEEVVEGADIFPFGNKNKKNEENEIIIENNNSNSIKLPFGEEKLPDLLVSKSSADWTQDPFWTQLRSPWLDDWAFYANALNF